MMVVSDLDDVFVPLPNDFLVNLSESRSVVESIFQDNTNLRGKLLIFQNTLPSLGVGRLKLRGDDLRVYGSDKEHLLRLPGDPFYKQIAAEFTKVQIGVDVYAFSDKYTDIASLVAEKSHDWRLQHQSHLDPQQSRRRRFLQVSLIGLCEIGFLFPI
ncbi:hypothetical protein EV1_006853 [Malus domestica]